MCGNLRVESLEERVCLLDKFGSTFTGSPSRKEQASQYTGISTVLKEVEGPVMIKTSPKGSKTTSKLSDAYCGCSAVRPQT